MPSILRVDAVNYVVDAAVAHLTAGRNSALVGAAGVGTTTARQLIQEGLVARDIPVHPFDCLGNAEDFSRQLRTAARDFTKLKLSEPNVLLIDHAAELGPDDLGLLLSELAAIPGENLTTFLWIGNLDARGVDPLHQRRIHSVPRSHLCFPDLARDELLAIYRKIIERTECRWGEAMFRFALDWCGNDLALISGLTEYFYGAWDRDIHDGSVAGGLEGWLANDPLVCKYRAQLAALPADCREYLALLSRGGKLHCPRPVHEEPDGAIRRLFLEGFVCANLLPGFWQLRNLLVRHLVLEDAAGVPPAAPITLLRRSANERVAELLQDAEVSLRSLLLAVFRDLPKEEMRRVLENKSTEQQLFEPEFKKTLLKWADVKLERSLRDELSRFLSDEAAAHDKVHKLWNKVCLLYRLDRGEKTVEPSAAEVVNFLTFNELADLIITFEARIFTKRDPFKAEAEQPTKRWQGYLARMRRLRNQTAHLRNVSFQDLEDLLAICRQMRTDLQKFAFRP